MIDFKLIEKKAASIRNRLIINSSINGIPHLGSCLSCVDLLTVFYFSDFFNIRENNFDDIQRNRFILSKGHAAPALICTLVERRILSDDLLVNYGKDGSYFGDHLPLPGLCPGVEAATGSLGHGLPIAAGIALSAKLKDLNYSVFVLVGDGECNEGSIWEAAMFAAAKKLNNICVIIDYNSWQATGRSNEIMSLDPLNKKWESFGWNTLVINGHSIHSIINAYKKILDTKKPLAIIANTIKGKGVSFMEDDNNWHYRIPTENEVKIAQKELGIS